MAVVQQPSLKEARDLFALYCRAKGLSLRTVESYLASVDELGAFLIQAGQGGALPTSQDIRSFVASLLDRSLAKTTISIRMRSVRCLFNFLVREEVITTSPMACVEIPRVPHKYPEILTHDEIKAILAAARQKTLDVPPGNRSKLNARIGVKGGKDVEEAVPTRGHHRQAA